MAPSLKPLASDLIATIDEYKDPSGQSGFLLRKKIIGLANQIISEVEEPEELTWKYSVYMGEMGALRLLMDWQALDHIPESGSITYTELAAKINAEEPLVRRMCWMLVSTGVLKQIGEDKVAHTKFSPLYANKNPQGLFFKIMMDEGMLPYTRWPDYFRTYGRKEPNTVTHVPHGFGWGEPEKTFWEMASGERLEDYNTGLQTADEFLPITGIFPFKWIAENAHAVADDAPLIVDVGGGRGHALRRIRAECPDIPRERMVLEDRPPVIEEVVRLGLAELQGVKKIAHDFFKEQPVKGALVYYLRRIMHDWSDDLDCTILGHLRDAMTPNSRILITEQVVTNPPSSLTAQTDLVLMNIGGKERTEKDWRTLIATAGLEIVKFWNAEATEVSVIECKKP